MIRSGDLSLFRARWGKVPLNLTMYQQTSDAYTVMMNPVILKKDIYRLCSFFNAVKLTRCRFFRLKVNGNIP